MKGRVLVLDGSFTSAPLVGATEELGYECFTVGNDPFQYFNRLNKRHLVADYSNVDVLRGILSDYTIDFVVPGCTDKSFDTFLQLLNKGSPANTSQKLIKNLANKALLKQSLRQVSLPIAREFRRAKEVGATDLPVIVKPIDSYSGRGVSVVRPSKNWQVDLDEAISFARRTSESEEIVIEEYLVGDLCSLSCFADSTTCFCSSIVAEDVDAAFKVVSSAVTDKFEHIRKTLPSKLRELLGKGPWFVHCQFIVNELNELPTLIDCAGRCPGDLYGLLLEKSTKFDYYKNYVRSFLNLPLDAQFSDPDVVLPVTRKTLQGFDMVSKPGLTFSNDCEFFPDVGWRAKSGSRIGVLFEMGIAR